MVHYMLARLSADCQRVRRLHCDLLSIEAVDDDTVFETKVGEPPDCGRHHRPQRDGRPEERLSLKRKATQNGQPVPSSETVVIGDACEKVSFARNCWDVHCNRHCARSWRLDLQPAAGPGLHPEAVVEL